mmetsp:Transcript_4049/g.7738  ORF Transcript_4049/g.7738 Transcript_4049/m.7738 type:complete len:423 (+) Transcript_4049:86-1354(+)
MIMLTVMFSVLIIGLPLAWWRDAARTPDEKSSDLQSERLFWESLQDAAWRRLFMPRKWSNWGASVKWRMARSHPWLSVALHPQGDFLDTRKRLVILVTLAFNSAAVCSLLAGTEQNLPGLGSDFSLLVVAFVLSYPTPYVLGTLFGRDMPKMHQKKWKGEKRRDLGAYCAYALCIFGYCLKSEFEFDGGDGEDMGDDDNGGGAEEGGHVQNEDLQGDEDHAKEDDDEDDKKGQTTKTTTTIAAASAIAGSSAFDATATATKNRRVAPAADIEKQPLKQPSKRKIAWSTGSLNSTMDDHRGSDGKLAAGRSMLLLGSSATSATAIVTRVSPPVGEPKNDGDSGDKDGTRVPTHRWLPKDYHGVAFGMLVSVGCAMLVAVLGYKHRHNEERVSALSYVLFMQDIACRILMIILMETIQIAPLGC